MSRKKKLRVILTNIFLFGLLFGLVSLNKEILRPSLSDIPIVKPTLGCFPNFIAAYIISLFFVNGALTMEPMHSRLIVSVGSVFVFAVLTAEELRPMWGASTHYDVLDIVASGMGALLAVFTYEVAVIRRKKASIGASIESEP
ncbi:MAG: hypothetical protein ACYSR6_05845 [Planctomycetota bacterium]|jgi:hypothetical protein